MINNDDYEPLEPPTFWEGIMLLILMLISGLFRWRK